MFSIGTWNVNSIKVRMQHLTQWVSEHQPDVLAIQETKIQDKDFPTQLFNDLHYHVIYSGQKTYNGVAIASRQPLEQCVIDLPGVDSAQKRFMAATVNNIRVINIYVPNGQTVDSEKYLYKLDWLTALKNYIEEQLNQHPQLLLLGDYNIAPEDRDVHDPKAWEGQVLVSEKERKSFQTLQQLGLVDTFRLFEHEKVIYSWWDYRALGLQLNRGLRIDHILASKSLSQHCISCEIDKAPRKWPQPSDHAPVLAQFDIS